MKKSSSNYFVESTSLTNKLITSIKNFTYQLINGIKTIKIDCTMSNKKDPDNTMSSSQISLQSSSSVKNLNPNDHLKCSSGHYAVKICLNDKCAQKNLFECFTSDCKCHENHEKCSMANVEYIRKYVNSKIHDTRPLSGVIETMINNKIQELNNLRQALLKILQDDFKYSKLFGVEKKFLGMVKGTVELQKLTASESKDIWQLAKLDKKKGGDISERLKTVLDTHGIDITSNINNLRNNIAKALQAQFKYLNETTLHVFLKSLDNHELKISQKFTATSAICQSKELSQCLIKFFPQKLANFELLFQASKNDFSIQKYFDVCGKVPNTLIVLKTEKDKIIGAYSPLIHDVNNSSGPVVDTSNTSFLFSLTDQQRFTLINNTRAIHRQADKKKIEFGYDEFQIGDKADKNNTCRSDVNYQYYQCPQYSKDNLAAYQKFSGSNARQFKAKEWEVWRVEFMDVNQKVT